jgi:hypothetical protein
MAKRQIWDRLKFQRQTEDGSEFYRGEKGIYLFMFNGSTDRAGRVILNRKFLTGLFRPKYSAKVRRYVGDLRGEKKFLLFDETGEGEITVYWTPKRK